MIIKFCKSLLTLCLLTTTLQAVAFASNNGTIIKQDSQILLENGFFNAQQQQQYLDQYEGQVVLLVFWATWCSSCETKMLQLDNLQKDFKKLPFKIIALAQDYKGLEMVSKYFKAHNIRHLDIFYDQNNLVFRELGVASLPTAYLISSDSRVKMIFRGEIKWYDNEVRRKILKEIGEHIPMPNNSFKSDKLNHPLSNDQNDNINKQNDKSENPTQTTK
jgi:thiol-disulfide isomerase/thioredoxin